MVDFQGFTVSGAEDARWFFDAFSWETFLAINQPGTAVSLYGNHPPRVWETWQSSRQIFPQTNTPECPDLANHPNAKVFVDGTSSGFHTSKLIPDYNEAFTYPLFDQTPAPVHYEVHINPTGSHTITSNRWTDPKT